MKRPAPRVAADHFLYVDMRDSSLTAAQALDVAIPALEDAVVGYKYFPAQQCLALIFSSQLSRDNFVGKTLPDTDLTMRSVPTTSVLLRKLTLQDVPFRAVSDLVQTLKTRLAGYGELVYLAPLCYKGLATDQWHATLSVNPDGSTPASSRHFSPQ